MDVPLSFTTFSLSPFSLQLLRVILFLFPFLLVLNPRSLRCCICFSLAVYLVSLLPPILPRVVQIAQIKLLISYSAAVDCKKTKD